MLEHLKAQQAAAGRREMTRLTILVGACLMVVAAIVLGPTCQSEPKPVRPEEETPTAPVVEPVTIDRARVAAVGDSASAHSDVAYERGALDYLVTEVAPKPLAEEPRSITAAELAALPFEEAAGRVFEVRGTVSDVEEREFRSEEGRLWSLVVEGEGGGRFVAVKRGLASDPDHGQPRDALWRGATVVREGTAVIVRGIYLQRRTGTIGRTPLGEPVPVLVAIAFRRAETLVPSIEDPSGADWSDVHDRFVGETKDWGESALYQMVQWARTKGQPFFAEGIRSGALEVKPWDRDTFGAWEKEIKVVDEVTPRPFTESARGKLWRLTGTIGQFVQTGWETIPSNVYGVDSFWLLDFLADDFAFYGNNIALRTISPFPPAAYPGEAWKLDQHVTLYGYFVKNHTYETKRASKEGKGSAPVTVPMFVVVHMDPIEFEAAPYRTFIIVLCAGIVLVGILFWLVLVRGESKEAKRAEEMRIRLRQRIRASTATPPPAPEPPPEP